MSILFDLFTQAFNISRLSWGDRESVSGYLNRHGRLSSPGVYRLFCSSAVEARCCRVDASLREYYGFTRGDQGIWEGNFFFGYVNGALLGQLSVSAGVGNVSTVPLGASEKAEDTGADIAPAAGFSCEAEVGVLKAVVSAFNRLRPRFLVCCGNFTAFQPMHPYADEAMNQFRRWACV